MKNFILDTSKIRFGKKHYAKLFCRDLRLKNVTKKKYIIYVTLLNFMISIYII